MIAGQLFHTEDGRLQCYSSNYLEMNYRELGKTGIRVSEIGLGCATLGGGVYYRNDKESLRLLDYAYDNNVNLFDTSSAYAYGNSEKLIGKAFHTKRDKVVIVSKVGFLPSSLGKYGKMKGGFDDKH